MPTGASHPAFGLCGCFRKVSHSRPPPSHHDVKGLQKTTIFTWLIKKGNASTPILVIFYLCGTTPSSLIESTFWLSLPTLAPGNKIFIWKVFQLCRGNWGRTWEEIWATFNTVHVSLNYLWPTFSKRGTRGQIHSRAKSRAKNLDYLTVLQPEVFMMDIYPDPRC
jgi:hypothetical protein